MALALIACSKTPAKQTIEGRWEGTSVAFGDTALLTVDFRHRGDSLTASVTMTAEALFVDYPLQNVSLHGDSLHMELVNHRGDRALFDGYVSGDTINGGFRKNSNEVYIKLLRTSTAIPDPPYKKEPVSFSSRDGTKLEGTLFLPDSGDRHAAVVLIHGSGPSVRIDLNYLADLFARHGIAALAYDKRGSGESGGAGKPSSLLKLAEDTEAAVGELARRSDIDRNSIGICGVSEGGWVAPIVAANDSTVSYVIAVVAPGTTYEENGIYQNSARLRSARANASEIDAYVKVTREISEIVRARLANSTDPRIPPRAAAAESKLRMLRKNPVYRVTDLPATVPDGAQLKKWRWQTLDFNPAPYWRRVTQPVLIVLGANDQNADAKSSVNLIGEALKKGGNQDATFVVFEGANHDLMVPGPGTGFRFMVPAPGYPDTLASWATTKVNSMRRR